MRSEEALRLFVGDIDTVDAVDAPDAGSARGVGGALAGARARLAPPAPLTPLAASAEFALPDAAAAHVKVRRLQPGDALRLFDGVSGEDWPAVVQAISRAAVRVRLAEAPVAAAAELPVAVALAFGMPANERVDALVEKATELGVAALWPLMSERSVLRLEGERAERRRKHWQAVAAAACEQCGRARVPRVHAVQPLHAWLQARRDECGAGERPEDGRGTDERGADDPGTIGAAQARWLLSTEADAPPLAAAAAAASAGTAASGATAGGARPPALRPTPPGGPRRILVLSGPEGGLAPAEIEAARAAGFIAVSLGPRILRADTAPLAALAWVAVAQAEAQAQAQARVQGQGPDQCQGRRPELKSGA